jgi:hypothetical protein
VKTRLGTIVTTLLLTALGISIAADCAAAEPPKPALTVAFAGYDQLTSNLKTIDQLDPHLGLVKKLEGYIGLVTKEKNLAGLDKSRPWGVLVTLGESDDPIIHGYVPVTDLKQLVASIPTPDGEALTPDANGVYEIDAEGRTIYAKQKGAWAIVCDNRDALDSAQADPTPQIADLAKKYLVAVRGDMRNVPADRRDNFFAALRNLVEFSLVAQGGSEEQQAMCRSLVKLGFDELETLKNGSDVVVAGLSMDKSLHVDLEVNAIAGSDLAAKFAAMKDAKSDYAGFVLPGAAVTAVASGKIDDREAAQAKEIIDKFKVAVAAELDANDELAADKRELAKQSLGEVLGVLQETIGLKKCDRGMALVLDDGPTIIAGATIAAGGKLDAAIRKLAKEIIADKPELDKRVKLDAETYDGLKFHVFTIPVSEPGAVEVFGQSVQLVVGLSESRFYIGAGKNPLELLKKAIAASKSNAGKPVLPLEMVVSAGSIAKFYAKAIPGNLPQLAQAKKLAEKLAEQLAKTPGQDRLRLTVKPIPGGAQVRLDVDPGAIRAIMELYGVALHIIGADASDDQ